jgi:2-oxo-3-hexenedioate decarboxylase
MDAAAQQALLDELVSLETSPREVAPFTERYPGLTLENAYAVSRRLHAHRVARGFVPRGRKIGFTNRTLWPRYGIDSPMWGHVYDRTLIEAPEGRARVALAGLVNVRLEPEIAFGIAATPRSASPDDLLAAVAWVAHSVEIVRCHHAGWKVTAADCAADNGLHGRLVVGRPVPLADLPNLAERLPAVELALRREGAEVARGQGRNVLGSPLSALGFLVEVLAQQPEAPPLRAGDVVTTGTLTDAYPPAPGERWTTQVSGLPLLPLAIEFSA